MSTSTSAAADEDPVVCEIPVHLAENLRRNLYMVQFPLRPAYRPMPTAPRAARLKPEHRILQLDYDVDQKSEHYDADAEDYLKQKYLRLQSAAVPPLSNYAVGVFRQGQLHLTPVSAVVQMRPSLAHIDDAIEDAVEDLDVDMEQEQKSAESAVKEVQFQFKKKPSERAITAIQNSYAYKKQQINAETWRELKVHDRESATTESEFENLFSEREEDVISTMSADEYLKALRYRTAAAESHSHSHSGNSSNNNNSEADAVALEKRVTPLSSVDAKDLDTLQCLMTEHITHFDDLVALLPKRSEDEVLAAVARVAVSVRGRLLPKSEYVSANEAAVQARQVILEALAKKPSGVSRVDIVDKHGLDAALAKTILESVAALDSTTRLWSFKRDPDDSFVKRFPAAAKSTKL
ncbi:hypothetical protein ATCC90586_005701 [Pythium insidiosum]|nr:hypothetical protein ATCC90586_005701 [Pythium insidiosum]